jgi:hypothetical protein
VPVATAGVNSSGHSAIEAISRATGVTYKHVTYDGGNPAVVATVAGETQVTTQLAAEQTDMIRAKKHPPAGGGGRQAAGNRRLRHGAPAVAPSPASRTRSTTSASSCPRACRPRSPPRWTSIWATQMASNEALRKYAAGRGAMFAPMHGDAAQAAVFPAIQSYAWTQQAAGKAKVSPDTVGIAKP